MFESSFPQSENWLDEEIYINCLVSSDTASNSLNDLEWINLLSKKRNYKEKVLQSFISL